MWDFWAFRQMHLADLTYRSITAHCLYDNWLSPYCRITARFPCCARTLRSVKTDAAAFAWLSLKSAVFVETERLLRQHLRCSSTSRSDSCRKTDIYVVTLGFFQNEMTLRGLSPLNASQSYNEMMCLTATLYVTMHACETSLDTWQHEPVDVCKVAADGIFSMKDSSYHTGWIYS